MKEAPELPDDVASESKEKAEINDLHDELIDDQFLEKYLSMIHLLTNVAKNAPIPKKMLKAVATPYHLQLLLELLTVVSPKSKLKLIKILESLMQNGIPQEVFNQASSSEIQR